MQREQNEQFRLADAATRLVDTLLKLSPLTIHLPVYLYLDDTG